jgi:hypothetical protein
MTNTPTSNFGYNKPSLGSRGWGVPTLNDNLDAIDADLATEHRSDVGNHGKHGPKVTVTQTGNDNALTVTKTDAGAADAIVVNNSGSGWDIKGTTGVWGATQDGIIACRGITGVNLSGATGVQGVTGSGPTGIQGATGIQGVTGVAVQSVVQNVGGTGVQWIDWSLGNVARMTLYGNVAIGSTGMVDGQKYILQVKNASTIYGITGLMGDNRTMDGVLPYVTGATGVTDYFGLVYDGADSKVDWVSQSNNLR